MDLWLQNDKTSYPRTLACIWICICIWSVRWSILMERLEGRMAGRRALSSGKPDYSRQLWINCQTQKHSNFEWISILADYLSLKLSLMIHIIYFLSWLLVPSIHPGGIGPPAFQHLQRAELKHLDMRVPFNCHWTNKQIVFPFQSEGESLLFF